MIGASFGDRDDDLASEDKPSRTKYWSKKEFVIVCVLLLVLLPFIGFFLVGQIDRSNDVFCRLNVRAIGQAVAGYSGDNDDRLPPTHMMDIDGSPKIIDGLGVPDTWASQVQPYLTVRQSFLCRSAKSDETMKTVSLEKGHKHFDISYGFYRGLSSVPKNQIPYPGSIVMVAETTNHGRSESYNPKRFPDDKPDGFLIGWDDGNLEFSKATKLVTRLAFSNAKSGYSGPNLTGRHRDRINAVTIDGSLRKLTAMDAVVEHAAPRLKNVWWADPNLFR